MVVDLEMIAYRMAHENDPVCIYVHEVGGLAPPLYSDGRMGVVGDHGADQAANSASSANARRVG